MSLVKSKIQGIKVDKVVDPSSRFDFPLLNNLAYTDNLVEKYLGKKNFLKEYLGKGTFGYAYLTKNGTVYKFTKNEKEAAASLILFMFGDKLKTQGKIYKVYEVVIGSERLFIIEKEYVKPIGQYIEKEFNLKAYQTYKPLIIIEGLLYSQYDNFETFEKEALEKADDEDAETFKIIKELFEKKNKLMRSIFEFNKLLGENEQDAGIPLNDQHVGNIGVKDNRVICFDCVTSSKYILKQGGMIKNEIKKSTIKSRLSEPAVKKIGKLGWSKVSPVIWKKIIDEKHHAYINNQGASYDLVIYDSSKSDKDPIDGGSFGSFEDAEKWLIENYVDNKMENGGITGEKVGDFIFVQKSDGYWRVFKKNGQKVAIIVKESNSLPNVLPYLSPIGKQDVFLVTSLAGKQEKFASLEDVKKAFAEFKMEDGGRSSEKTEIKFSSYSSDRKIMTFTRSDFKEMLNEINRNFKGRLFYATDKVTKLTDIFNYGTLFPDYISFTFKIKDINPISDGEKLKNIIEKYTDRVNWSYGSIILYEKESDWNVAVTISPQLIDTQSKRTLDDNRTEHKFQEEKHDDDYLIPDNITVKLENGSLIDSPKILGSTLKKYFKQKYDLDIDTTYKKTVRGLDDSYYQISSYRSGKSIPNEVRREIIEISHGKPISEIGVLNQNDISYGTIEPKRISVSGKVWKEWIKSKETKNELDNGGNIDFENTPNIEIDQDQEYLIEKAIPWIKKGMSDNYIQWKLYASRGLNTSIEDIVEAIRLARLRLMKHGGRIYNGIPVPKTVNPNTIISAFQNEIDSDKMEKYTEIMKSEMLSHDFPPIEGYPTIICYSDIGEYFLNGDEITEDDIGKKAWKVTDGHHRSIAAINAHLPYIEVKLDYSAVTDMEEYLSDGGKVYDKAGLKFLLKKLLEKNKDIENKRPIEKSELLDVYIKDGKIVVEETGTTGWITINPEKMDVESINAILEWLDEKKQDGGTTDKKYVIASGNKKLSSVYTNALGTSRKWVGQNEPGADNLGMITLPAPTKIFVFRTGSWMVFDSIEDAKERIDGWKKEISKDDRYTDEIRKSLMKYAENLKNKIYEKFEDGGDLDREFIERSYGKESVKNIIKNEGLIYAIRSYMGYESINEKEDKLRSLWKQAGEQIDMVEESAKKEGYDPGYLVHDKKEGYRIISKPEGDEISVSNVSKDLQDKVSKANDLFLKILNYVGLSEKQFGSKFEDGGEIKTKRKITFYHGVKREENVEKILKSGFDLKHINPLWQNDYAISVTRNPESIRRFFGNKNIPIIKIEFEGVIVPQVEIGFLLAKDAVDYTNQIIRMGIDAVALDGSFGQAFIYNLKSIKNISLLPTGSKKEDGGTTKDKRYAVTTDMYSYAPDDKSVIKKSQEFVGDLRKRLDNQASIVEIVEAPFGSIKTRKLENVPKYDNGARIEGVDTKYTRVIPRDLFNESKLLKCVGRLILLIHDNSVPVEMSFEENGDPFKIGLMDEGALTITNLKIFIKNKEYIFKTTYNSKSNYPFYVQHDYVDYRVFDEKGDFDKEFIEFCKTVPKYENGGNIEWEDIPNIDLGFEPSQDWMKLWEDFKRKNKLKVELPHANPKDRGEQSDNAYFMLRHIVAIKRGNWTPDWNNSSEYKYYPWFYMDRKHRFAFDVSNYVFTRTSVGSRLCFPSAELCEAVAKEFLPIYKVYFTEK